MSTSRAASAEAEQDKLCMEEEREDEEEESAAFPFHSLLLGNPCYRAKQHHFFASTFLLLLPHVFISSSRVLLLPLRMGDEEFKSPLSPVIQETSSRVVPSSSNNGGGGGGQIVQGQATTRQCQRSGEQIQTVWGFISRENCLLVQIRLIWHQGERGDEAFIHRTVSQ